MKPSITLAKADLQLMVRAEQASYEMNVKAIMKGEKKMVFKERGMCACITCGKILPYKASAMEGHNQIQGGHFDHHFRLCLEIENVNPQCVSCNKWKNGAPTDYRKWMFWHHGPEVIDALTRMKLDRRSTQEREDKGAALFPSEWSDDYMIFFRRTMRRRTQAAEEVINRGSAGS